MQPARVPHYRPEPVPSPPWRPKREDLATLGRAGRRLVRTWLAEFRLDGAEGKVLLLAAAVEDQLEAVRQVDRVPLDPIHLAALERRERSAIKLLAHLLKQLQVTK